MRAPDHLCLDGLADIGANRYSHPQRRALIHVIRYVYLRLRLGVVVSGLCACRFIFSVVVLILDIRYWFTRRSTVSISILGTALMSGSELFVKLGSFLVKQNLQGSSVPQFIASLLLSISTSLVLPLLMIKTILHIELHWWNETTWIPIMQRLGATHRERASERLEASTSWRTKAAVRVAVTVL
jgi:hypothetical protein